MGGTYHGSLRIQRSAGEGGVMPPTNDSMEMARAVGKIEGQLRELIHGQNNQNQKLWNGSKGVNFLIESRARQLARLSTIGNGTSNTPQF
jgi:hypothetical protein